VVKPRLVCALAGVAPMAALVESPRVAQSVGVDRPGVVLSIVGPAGTP
jgi:hypothetical protein